MIDIETIKASIKDKGYHILKNQIPFNDFKTMRELWLNYYKKNLDTPGINNMHKTGVILGDSNYLARSSDQKIKMFRLIQYLWNKPIDDMTINYGKFLHKIRNRILNKDENFGIEFNSNNIAVFIQTNFYPGDGGFMYEHVDGYSNTPKINITFNLTFKGTDFDDGGISVIDKQNNEIKIDEIVEPTDVAIFDGNLKHEVKKVYSSKGIGRIGVFPIVIKFYNNQEIPHYLKKISHAHYAIKRRLGITTREKLPDES